MFERIHCTDVKEWLNSRGMLISDYPGMGGSEVAAALGYSPYKSSDDVYNEMVRLVERKNISDKPQVRYGSEAEKHITALFALEYPHIRVETYPYDVLIDTKHPWRRASLDAELFWNTLRGVFEVKTSRIRDKKELAKWTGQIPIYYLIQVLWYLGITGYDFAILRARLILDFYYEKNEFPEVIERTYYIDANEFRGQTRKIQADGDKFIEQVMSRKRPDAVLTF
jgi:putative phage-type endonuclease